MRIWVIVLACSALQLQELGLYTDTETAVLYDAETDTDIGIAGYR